MYLDFIICLFLISCYFFGHNLEAYSSFYRFKKSFYGFSTYLSARSKIPINSVRNNGVRTKDVSQTLNIHNFGINIVLSEDLFAYDADAFLKSVRRRCRNNYYHYHSDSNKSTISNNIGKNATNASNQEIWVPLSHSEIAILTRLLQLHCSSLSPQAFCDLCHNLGRLRIDSSFLTAVNRPLLNYIHNRPLLNQWERTNHQFVENKENKFYLSPQDINRMLQGLGYLNLEWSTLSRKIILFYGSKKLSFNLPCCIEFNESAGSSSPLPAFLHHCLLDSPSSSSSSIMDAYQLSDLLRALCSLRAKWTELSPELRTLLLQRSQHCLSVPLTPQALSNIAWALARLGVRWPQLADSALLSRVALLPCTPTPQQASKLLWALGLLEPPPGLLPLRALESLLHCCCGPNHNHHQA